MNDVAAVARKADFARWFNARREKSGNKLEMWEESNVLGESSLSQGLLMAPR